MSSPSSNRTANNPGHATCSNNASENTIHMDHFYDSVISHFSLAVFCQQFALQITFPLLLPIFYWRYGSFFLATHGFLPSLPNIINFYLPQCIFVYLVTSFWLKNGVESEVYRAMIMPLFLMTVHRIMISVKYACLSPSEYRRMMRGVSSHNQYGYPSKKNRELAVLFREKIQLITNFHSVSSPSLWLEIYSASKIIPIDLSTQFMTVTTGNPILCGSKVAELLRWENLLRNFYTDVPMQDMIVPVGKGTYTISAKVIMGALYGKLKAPLVLKRSILSSTSLGILFAMIPFLNLEKRFSSYDTTTQFQLGLVFLFSIIYFSVVVVFGWVAIADQIRRTNFALFLGEMIHYADSTLRLDFRISNTRETSRNDMKILPDVLTYSSTNTTVRNVSVTRESLLTAKDESEMKAAILMDTAVSDSINNNSYDECDDPLNDIRMPSLDFSSANNLTAWFSMRRVVQSLNNRLRFRIDMYIMILIIAFVLTIIYILGLSFGGRSVQSVMTRTDNVQLVFSVFVCVVILCVYICIGGLSNLRMERHCSYLGDMANKIQAVRSDIVSKSSVLTESQKRDIKQLDEFSNNLHAIIRMVMATDLYNFVSVMGGVKCTYSLAFSVVTTLVAVISFSISA